MAEPPELQACRVGFEAKQTAQLEAELVDLQASSWCCMAMQAAQLVAKLAQQQVHDAGRVKPGMQLEKACN